ncbi:MAG: hypothetical protein LBM98_09515 [Oscillospiraceae bacterium]|nr:hypothetical protein [Oscillospiraceae bacterium]
MDCFARLAMTGRALPCPVPAHCAGTGDGVTSARRGNHPAPAGAPLHRGDGVWTWITGLRKLRAARNDGAPGRWT